MLQVVFTHTALDVVNFVRGNECGQAENAGGEHLAGFGVEHALGVQQEQRHFFAVGLGADEGV